MAKACTPANDLDLLFGVTRIQHGQNEGGRGCTHGVEPRLYPTVEADDELEVELIGRRFSQHRRSFLFRTPRRLRENCKAKERLAHVLLIWQSEKLVEGGLSRSFGAYLAA